MNRLRAAKYRRGGSANNWWLRSPNVSNSTNFRYINSTGNVNNNNANNSWGVAPGFHNPARGTGQMQ